jgi:hypothetical protein
MAGAALVGSLACRSDRPAPVAGAVASPAVADSTRASSRVTPIPADTVVGTAAHGVELWFTLARPDSGPDGPCVDRALEIRRYGRRIPVPLVYTVTAPEPVNDSTVRVRLASHCRPGDAYRVDLRTGRPTRESR